MDELDPVLVKLYEDQLAAGIQPLFTACDGRFEFRHFKIQDRERLRVTVAAKRGDEPQSLEPLALSIEDWSLAIAPAPPSLIPLETLIRDRVPPAGTSELSPDTIEAFNLELSKRTPLVVLRGLFYLEVVYVLDRYLLHVYRPLAGKRRHTDILELYAQPCPPRFPTIKVESHKLPARLGEVTVHTTKDNFIVAWDADYMGYGQLNFRYDADGKIHCNTENMPKEFIKAVLCKIVDDMVWEP